MKIELKRYDTQWKKSFEEIKTNLIESIGFANPHIEHIGSTSVDELSAKPIIDILIGLETESLLDKVVEPLLEQGCIYYEIYNELMPYRRFFVKHKTKIDNLNILKIIKDEQYVPKSTEEHNLRLAHIHVLKYNSEHWIRHIAFRDYLIAHLNVKVEYQRLKETLSLKDWLDGNDYNKAKDTFIKREERKAITWYNKTTKR